MSLGSKFILISSCLTTVGIIGYVHYKQEVDREKMHEGVLNDIERQQRRKTQNVVMLMQQAELTKQLRKNENENKEELP